MNMTKLLLVVCFVSFICSNTYSQPAIQILEVFSQRVKLKVLNATDPLTITWGDCTKTVTGSPDTVWINSAVKEGMVISVSDSNGSESITIDRLLQSSDSLNPTNRKKIKNLIGVFNFVNNVVHADSFQKEAKIKTV